MGPGRVHLLGQILGQQDGILEHKQPKLRGSGQDFLTKSKAQLLKLSQSSWKLNPSVQSKSSQNH